MTKFRYGRGKYVRQACPYCVEKGETVLITSWNNQAEHMLFCHPEIVAEWRRRAGKYEPEHHHAA